MNQKPPISERSADEGRYLSLDGTYNLRDVGGYKTIDGRMTRWGVLFRSDNLHKLPEQSQEILLTKELRTIIDLRHPMETEHWPNVFAGSEQVRYLNLPLNSVPADPEARAKMTFDLVEMNRRYLDGAQPQLATVLREIANADWPVLVQCQAGKDRTGLVLALLLANAGVPSETIAEDYALSAQLMGGAWMEIARESAERLNVPWDSYEKLLVCPPEFMFETLAYIEEHYGSVAEYLALIGLEEEELATLRAALVE